MTIQSQSARVVWDGTNIATTNMIYNADSGKAATSGWFEIKSDHVVLQVCVATLTATTLTYRVEGRFDTFNRAASIYTENVTSAYSIDKLIEISEKVKEIRVGAKVDNVASLAIANNIFYAGLVLTDIN
jgi:hypothetical protein